MARKVRNLFILAILILTSIFISSFKLMVSTNYQISQENPSKIQISQGTQNFTIDTYLPSLVWLNPQLKLNISANQTGQIQCFFCESDGPQFFSVENRSLSLTGNNLSQIIYLQLVPLINALPGVYQFSLNITGAFSYYENFEIVYGFGVILLVVVFSAIIIIPIIIIVKKPKGVKDVKTEEMTNMDKSETIMSSIAGKIHCPKCRKSIDEGLTFCPECGERIPEFLRYNAPSGI